MRWIALRPRFRSCVHPNVRPQLLDTPQMDGTLRAQLARVHGYACGNVLTPVSSVPDQSLSTGLSGRQARDSRWKACPANVMRVADVIGRPVFAQTVQSCVQSSSRVSAVATPMWTRHLLRWSMRSGACLSFFWNCHLIGLARQQHQQHIRCFERVHKWWSVQRRTEIEF